MQLQLQYKLTGHRGAIYDTLIYGDQLLSTGGDGWVVSWDTRPHTPDGTLIATVEGKIFTMAMIRPGLLVLGDMYGHLFWVDLDSRTTIKNVKHHAKGVYDLVVVGKHLYSTSADGYLTMWDIESMMPIESLQVAPGGLRSLIVNDEDTLLIGTSDNQIVQVDIEQWMVRRRIDAHSNSVFALTKTADHLLSGGRDAMLKAWTLPDLEADGELEAHWYTINDLLYLPNIDMVVSASRDKSIRLWDAATLTPLHTMGLQQGGHLNSVNTLSHHNGYIYSAGDDRSIIVWQLLTS